MLSSFVFGEKVNNVDVDKFVLESLNMHYMNEKYRTFSEFGKYCLDKGVPLGSVFVSDRVNCRECGKKLLLDEAWKAVLVYHVTRGTYLGCRLTKRCSKCRIYEHYGYFTKSEQKRYDCDLSGKEFLLSSQDTAVDMIMLRYVEEEFVIGAMPFKLKADVYNSFHGYGYGNERVSEDEEDDVGEGLGQCTASDVVRGSKRRKW